MGCLMVGSSPELLFSVSLSVARVAVDRFRLEALDAAGLDWSPDWPQNPRYLFHPCRQSPDWLERAPTQASSSCVSRLCPPVSGPSASNLRGRDSPTVSWARAVRVFHIGNFPSARSFLVCLDRSGLEPSTNVLPRILTIRRCRSHELFVSRFRYYYVLRLLHVHRLPLRFRL